jgi:RimJ/RimL family protein N-acetyltransferase
MMSIPVQQLHAGTRPALKAHFVALSPEDRRLRFGSALNDESIERYIDRIDFARDDVFAVVNDRLELVGVAHLAFSDDTAEFGVSVLSTHRGKGIGSALLARAHERARNRFVRKLFVHCLAENQAMLHLARKAQMEVVIEYGDADAVLELPRADTASLADELVHNQVALFDYALKAQLFTLQRIKETMHGDKPRKA